MRDPLAVVRRLRTGRPPLRQLRRNRLAPPDPLGSFASRLPLLGLGFERFPLSRRYPCGTVNLACFSARQVDRFKTL